MGFVGQSIWKLGMRSAFVVVCEISFLSDVYDFIASWSNLSASGSWAQFVSFVVCYELDLAI